MEKEEQSGKKELFIKLLPCFVAVLSLLIIGLSMIKNFYLIKVDDEKTYVTFFDLIGGKIAGTRLSVFYILIYIAFPVISAGLLFFNKFHKNFAFISLFIFLLCGVISIVSKDVFAEVLANKLEKSVSVKEVCSPALVPTIGFFILSILILSFSSNEIKFTTRDLTESGVLIAAALGLNFIKLFPAPTGGSVNLQVLPLFILAIRRGAIKSFVGCGIVYGLISCLTDGYGFAFFPFDYLVAFGGCAVLGFFSKWIIPEDKESYNFKGMLMLTVGAITTMIIRFIGGCISSILFYSYSITAAMLYNAGYIFISGGLALAILLGLYGPLLKVNKLYPPQKA